MGIAGVPLGNVGGVNKATSRSFNEKKVEIKKSESGLVSEKSKEKVGAMGEYDQSGWDALGKQMAWNGSHGDNVEV